MQLKKSRTLTVQTPTFGNTAVKRGNVSLKFTWLAMNLSGFQICFYVFFRCKYVLNKPNIYESIVLWPIYTRTGSILYLIQRGIKKSGRILTLRVNILIELQWLFELYISVIWAVYKCSYTLCATETTSFRLLHSMGRFKMGSLRFLLGAVRLANVSVRFFRYDTASFVHVVAFLESYTP